MKEHKKGGLGPAWAVKATVDDDDDNLLMVQLCTPVCLASIILYVYM
jgi:hypothetical protein